MLEKVETIKQRQIIAKQKFKKKTLLKSIFFLSLACVLLILSVLDITCFKLQPERY